MAYFYYRKGPFVTTTILKSMPKKEIIIDRLTSKKNREIFFVKTLQNSILLSFKPPPTIFSLSEFSTQRIFITFSEDVSGSEVHCDIRPFYSIVLLPIFISFFIIVNVILPNQYASIPMKIFGVIVACLIGLALFFPFRPKSDTINRVKSCIESTETSCHKKMQWGELT